MRNRACSRPTPAGRWRGWVLAASASMLLHAAAVVAVVAARHAPEPPPAPRPAAIDTRVTEDACALFLDDEPAPPEPPAALPLPVVAVGPPAADGATEEPAEPGPPGAVPGKSARTRPGLPTAAPPARDPVAPPARSVVYVLDRSASMGRGGRLALASRLLSAHLAGLPASARFGVLAYHSRPAWLAPADTANTPAGREALAAALAGLPAEGASAHAEALKLAAARRPEAVVWLTDAADLPPADLPAVRAALAASRCRLHAVTLGGPAPAAVADLCRAGGGGCRRE